MLAIQGALLNPLMARPAANNTVPPTTSAPAGFNPPARRRRTYSQAAIASVSVIAAAKTGSPAMIAASPMGRRMRATAIRLASMLRDVIFNGGDSPVSAFAVTELLQR